MESILEFAKQNYLIFTVLSIILVLAIIGYFAEKRLKRDVVIKASLPQTNNASQTTQSPETIPTNASLNVEVEEPLGLNMNTDTKES